MERVSAFARFVVSTAYFDGRLLLHRMPAVVAARKHNKQDMKWALSRQSSSVAGYAAERNVVVRNSGSEELPSTSKTVTTCPRDFRFVFPDFLPEPQFDRRNHKKEILERGDMLQRRLHLDIPEFYVGSILAVSVSDPYSAGRKNRFVGICIARGGVGLKHHFTLRNCIDGMGVEVRYEIYNPLIQKIEVLKLEKRLDDELYYLRDSLPEYSTFSQDMEPVPHAPGAPIPINPVKTRLKPNTFWTNRWERFDLKGVETFWQDISRRKKRIYARRVLKPWEKYDVIKDYRTGVVREDEERIFSEMVDFQEKHAVIHRGKRKDIIHHHRAKPQHMR